MLYKREKQHSGNAEKSEKEKIYENFLKRLEDAQILNRKRVKDENGNELEKWDFKHSLIILN